MKRIFCILIAAALMLSFAACTGSEGSEIQQPLDVSMENPVDEATQETDSPKETEAEITEAEITETVLVDESGVKITAKELDPDGIFGPEIKLLIENNSGKDLTFQGRNASVNGYMTETMMSVDVVDGKKANDALIFLGSDLEACGIETVADMEFSFHIFTTDDWEDYLDTSSIQLKTTMADTYEYTFDDSGDVVHDENGIKIVVKGLAENDSILGPNIVVYIENNSDKDVTIQTRDVSVNGFMVDAMFSSDVMVGKHAVDSITFLSSEIEENGIDEIQTVELSFHIFDFAQWETIVDTDIVTLAF